MRASAGEAQVSAVIPAELAVALQPAQQHRHPVELGREVQQQRREPLDLEVSRCSSVIDLVEAGLCRLELRGAAERRRRPVVTAAASSAVSARSATISSSVGSSAASVSRASRPCTCRELFMRHRTPDMTIDLQLAAGRMWPVSEPPEGMSAEVPHEPPTLPAAEHGCSTPSRAASRAGACDRGRHAARARRFAAAGQPAARVSSPAAWSSSSSPSLSSCSPSAGATAPSRWPTRSRYASSSRRSSAPQQPGTPSSVKVTAGQEVVQLGRGGCAVVGKPIASVDRATKVVHAKRRVGLHRHVPVDRQVRRHRRQGQRGQQRLRACSRRRRLHPRPARAALPARRSPPSSTWSSSRATRGHATRWPTRCGAPEASHDLVARAPRSGRDVAVSQRGATTAELDAAAGDGDFGAILARAARGVLAALDGRGSVLRRTPTCCWPRHRPSRPSAGPPGRSGAPACCGPPTRSSVGRLPPCAPRLTASPRSAAREAGDRTLLDALLPAADGAGVRRRSGGGSRAGRRGDGADGGPPRPGQLRPGGGVGHVDAGAQAVADLVGGACSSGDGGRIGRPPAAAPEPAADVRVPATSSPIPTGWWTTRSPA